LPFLDALHIANSTRFETVVQLAIMDEQVLQLLRDTLKSDNTAIRNAEQQLRSAYHNPQFPFALLAAASQDSINISIRKAALTALKGYVSAAWSPQFDETFQGQIYLDHEAKARVRDQIFGIAANQSSVELQPLAANVVGKIANSDFPDEWPDLFESIISIINTSNYDSTIKGALKVLYELIDSGLTEDQFFAVARELVSAFHRVASSSERGLNVRAFALNVFQSSFDMLEMVMADHGPAVKRFLDESLAQWMEFFTSVLSEPIPPPTGPKSDKDDPRRGLITLKVQVVKTIDKLRRVYASGIAASVLPLFQVIWQDLERISAEYNQLFIDGDEESKLADENDQLPYSLDAVVIEELDMLQVVLKAPTVKAELTQQLQQHANVENGHGWVQQLLDLLIRYARAGNEEQAMWDADADLYLTDINSISLNYTPRVACAEVVAQTLLPWLKQTMLEAILFYDAQLTSGARNASWKDTEALLYLLNQGLKEAEDGAIQQELGTRLMEQMSKYLQHSNPYVRGGTQLALGSFFKLAAEAYPEAAANAFSNAVQAISQDDSDIVKVACFAAIPNYTDSMPQNTVLPFQQAIFDAVADFMVSHDFKDELEEADEVKGALVTALHEAMLLNISIVMDSSAIDSFLTLASEGASSPIISQQLIDAFESLVLALSSNSPEGYAKLCSKTVPSLTAAFDVGDLTSENDLTTLAAELLSLLAENGTDPLPEGFVAASMPKLQRILMNSTVDTLVRPATTAVQHLLSKGTAQFTTWTDSSGTSSLEVSLTIINRLLNAPEIDESAAQEVGALASSVVSRFGADKLGPYLLELLRAVATRLASAQEVYFIQSLCMVFVSLSVAAPKDVVDFLSQLTINGADGLNVVMTRWLENSILFAGFDEVRQNIVALSKLFSLQDQRIKAIGVKGDLIIDANPTGRIKTRSQARLNPDRYTTIPADLKILKLLVSELDSAMSSQGRFNALAGGTADDEEEEEVDDDEWNDVANAGSAVDLDNPVVRAELMGFAEGDDGAREGLRDDEAATYLQGWFKEEGAKPGFDAVFAGMTGEEQEKLRRLVV
jgi:importin-9